MSSLIRLLAAEVAKEAGGGMDSLFLWDAIDRHFASGEPFRLMGRPYDLARHSGAIERFLAQAAEAMAARVGDARDIQNVILVGGPSKLYEPAIRKALPGHSIQVAEEPAFANVRGFQLVGEELAAR
jgi:plasmid segregation protein ParM